MRNSFSAKIEERVHEFIDGITQLATEEAADLLRANVGSGATRTARVSAPRASGQGRGVKRDKSVLADAQVAFVDYVTKNPGLRIEQINEALGTTTKDLALPIRKAIASKQVRTEGEKRATKYFAGGSAKAGKAAKKAKKAAKAAKKAAKAPKATKAAKASKKSQNHVPPPETDDETADATAA